MSLFGISLFFFHFEPFYRTAFGQLRSTILAGFLALRGSNGTGRRCRPVAEGRRYRRQLLTPLTDLALQGIAAAFSTAA